MITLHRASAENSASEIATLQPPVINLSLVDDAV